jgi:hypothetical protein
MILFACVVAALLSGCDSVSSRQFLVRDASPADRKAVLTATAEAAAQTGLVDRTFASRIPDTLVWYDEPKAVFPISLGARRNGPDVVIDLWCFHPGPPSWVPPSYKGAETVLQRELTLKFGARLTVDPKPRIELPPRLPPSQPSTSPPATAPSPDHPPAPAGERNSI